MSYNNNLIPILQRLVKDMSTKRLLECMTNEETPDQEIMDLVYEELRARGVFEKEEFLK